MNPIQPVTLAFEPEVSYQEKPVFELVKGIPKWAVPQIELAVKDFIATSHLPKGVDAQGFYQQTLGAIANATMLGGSGDFWLGTIDGKVWAYCLSRVVCDIDNKLTYWVSQAWVHQDWRRTPFVKEAWGTVRERAKNCFCSHFIVVSSRSTKAYLRWLGANWNVYATLLKEDI